jgi:hypothetical protein
MTAIDTGALRKELEKLRDEIAELDGRRETLLTAYKGLEAFMALRSGNGRARQLKMTPVRGRSRNEPKGTISMASASLTVLEEAQGAPLHAGEIYTRAQRLGAISEAKQPAGIVDLELRKHLAMGAPIASLGERVWRWVGN